MVIPGSESSFPGGVGWGGGGLGGLSKCDVRKMRCSNLGQCHILDNYITIQAEVGILLWVDCIDTMTGENKIP